MSLREYEDFVYGACHVARRRPDRALARHGRGAGGPRARARGHARGADHRPGHRPAARRRRAPLARRRTGSTTCPTARSSPARSRPRRAARSASPSRRSSRAGRSRTCACASRTARVVHAEATRGRTTSARCSTPTTGARVLGEVAFGLNYEIDRFTRDILFDEKIGGTMHFALGSASTRPAARTSRTCTGT